MTEHALSAVGKSMQAELATSDIDVTLINPGPYNAGFNNRTGASLSGWFDDKEISAQVTEHLRTIGLLVTAKRHTLAQCSDSEIRIKHDDLNFKRANLIDLMQSPLLNSSNPRTGI